MESANGLSVAAKGLKYLRLLRRMRNRHSAFMQQKPTA